eukprot:5993275-Prymnesium_polylepis.1
MAAALSAAEAVDLSGAPAARPSPMAEVAQFLGASLEGAATSAPTLRRQLEGPHVQLLVHVA